MIDLEKLTEAGSDCLPGLIGVAVTNVEDGALEVEAPVRRELMAPNGYLHAGSVVSLADTACGYGCMLNLPEGAMSFTTIELKSNFLGTAREGTLHARAEVTHRGRTTQIWDAEVFEKESGKRIALFRCTQMILYPKG